MSFLMSEEQYSFWALSIYREKRCNISIHPMCFLKVTYYLCVKSLELGEGAILMGRLSKYEQKK